MGTYAITQGSLALSSNYTLSYTGANLSILAAMKELTITANNRSKTYGDSLTFGGTEFTVIGLEGSDTVTSVTLYSSGAGATATVGSYDIVPSAAIGTGLGNYTIIYVNGTLTVNTKPVTITADQPQQDLRRHRHIRRNRVLGVGTGELRCHHQRNHRQQRG